MGEPQVCFVHDCLASLWAGIGVHPAGYDDRGGHVGQLGTEPVRLVLGGGTSLSTQLPVLRAHFDVAFASNYGGCYIFVTKWQEVCLELMLVALLAARV